MELTQEFIKRSFYYHKDGYLIWKECKRKDKIGLIAGCRGRDKYGDRRRIFFNNKLQIAYRLIFLWHHGYLPKIIDHINRNSGDDRIENLRPASDSENAANRKKSTKICTSKYLGVHFEKSRNLWKTKINKNGKSTEIGRFKTEAEAALAYNRKAVEYHGEFANLNIIKY